MVVCKIMRHARLPSVPLRRAACVVPEALLAAAGASVAEGGGGESGGGGGGKAGAGAAAATAAARAPSMGEGVGRDGVAIKGGAWWPMFEEMVKVKWLERGATGGEGGCGGDGRGDGDGGGGSEGGGGEDGGRRVAVVCPVGRSGRSFSIVQWRCA